jgi:2-polyprenyl-3-methyl-5-hydroxy-6-metoxy-1,4-benzoquinol methylase
MTAVATTTPFGSLEHRARLTRGSSSGAVYAMVVDAVRSRRLGGGCLVDVGCGRGALWEMLRGEFASYCGLDAVPYDGFPIDGSFLKADLDCPTWPIEEGIADLVLSLETIEHLENPWAFMRGLARIAKPGAWVMVTTPNQLSGLSLLALAANHRFAAFTDAQYPVHKTALLEVDLRRQAAAGGLVDAVIRYTSSGRIPKLSWHFPRVLSQLLPRVCSDNLMLIARKPL